MRIVPATAAYVPCLPTNGWQAGSLGGVWQPARQAGSAGCVPRLAGMGALQRESTGD